MLPLALTLTTAAIATIGLYFWPGSDSPWGSPHESEDEIEVGGRSRKSKRHQYFDRITEEDTDDLIEDARRDELLRKEKSARRHNTGSARHNTSSSSSTMMAGALVVDKIEHAVGKAADLLPGTSGRKKAEAIKEIKREAEEVSKKQQYVPTPARKKNVAIVVSERKVLLGESSDPDFEEAGLPSVSYLILAISYCLLIFFSHSYHIYHIHWTSLIQSSTFWCTHHSLKPIRSPNLVHFALKKQQRQQRLQRAALTSQFVNLQPPTSRPPHPLSLLLLPCFRLSAHLNISFHLHKHHLSFLFYAPWPLRPFTSKNLSHCLHPVE